MLSKDLITHSTISEEGMSFLTTAQLLPSVPCWEPNTGLAPILHEDPRAVSALSEPVRHGLGSGNHSSHRLQDQAPVTTEVTHGWLNLGRFPCGSDLQSGPTSAVLPAPARLSAGLRGAQASGNPTAQPTAGRCTSRSRTGKKRWRCWVKPSQTPSCFVSEEGIIVTESPVDLT